MASCNTCRYWEPLNLRREYNERDVVWRQIDPDLETLRGDEDPVVLQVWGVCHREDFPEAPMFTVDASNYYSTLSTRSSFHCSEYSEASTHG